MSDFLYPEGDPKPLREATDITPEVIDAAYECADAAYGLGNDFRIDWDRAYTMLETQFGFLIEEFDSPADRKIRREVNKRRRNDGLGVGTTEEI